MLPCHINLAQLTIIYVQMLVKNEKRDILAKYLFIKGILHLYVLEDKHDDPLVRTILRRGKIFSVFPIFHKEIFLLTTARDESRSRPSRVSLKYKCFRRPTFTLTSRLIITYCDLINCSIWPNLAEYAKDVCEFEKEGCRKGERKKIKRRKTNGKKKNEKITRKAERDPFEKSIL